uniref:Predicted protein n=2 Tax=Mesangiospermae TaxID=1437183 RepID=F2DLR4_HORVV|nr:predicted protein [Hordeum vulgare subsp. vulgare]
MGETFPDELSDAFGVKRGLRLDDLLAEVGADFKIYRKDLEMAERARTYTHTQLKQDIDEQIKIEKRRRHQRKIDSLAFSKDPS